MSGPQDAPATVAAAMIRRPKVCGPDATVADAHAVLADGHVHCVLVVDDGLLVAVVDRDDIRSAAPHRRAREFGGLAGRTVRPDADLAAAWQAMRRDERRRMAVVDAERRLVGLLCLKRSGRGFCSDDDIAERAAELGRALPALRGA